MIANAHDSAPDDGVAIVTGGECGHGRNAANELARRGYAVVISYSDSQRDADATVDEILAARGAALAVRADVADDLDVGRLFTETDAAFGGVDVVVHAAGRLCVGSVVDCEPATFDALLLTNARGAFLVNRQAARQLRDGGAIVNLCSSIVGLAQLACGAYVTSMGAVEAMTPILARELGRRRITVNAVAVAPGPADPADGVAGLVAFLVGRAGRCVNGQVIPTATPFLP